MHNRVLNQIEERLGLKWTLSSASSAIANGEISCSELMAYCLARAEATQPSIHALSAIAPERAAEEARELDRELAAGRYRGRLHGMPVAVKDIIDVAGYPTSAGSRVLAGKIAGSDAEIVAYLRRLGAIVVGKATTHEFAFGATTPPTRNPWSPDRIAGGSSGGSAAAVAAGVSLIAIGTDTGGSVCLPAALCGVAGLRPRRRADIGLAGIIPLAPEFDQWGLMARNVADLVLIWSALVTPAAPTRKLPTLITPEDLRATIPELDPEVEVAFLAALDRADRAGYRILRKPLPDVRDWRRPRMRIQLRQVLQVHHTSGWWPSSKELYSDETRANLEMAERQAGLALEPERERLSELDDLIDAYLGRAAVIVLPTTPVTAPRAADIASMAPKVGERHPIVGLLGQVTLPFARPALACMTLCCGITGQGLPVGAQLVGTDEADLFSAAAPF